MQANLSLVRLRFYSKNAPGLFAPSVRTLTSTVSRNAAFQKMDCLAPASFTSFTHTRDIRDMHPPSRQARELAEGQKNAESRFFSPRSPLRLQNSIGIGHRI